MSNSANASQDEQTVIDKVTESRQAGLLAFIQKY